MNETMVAVPRDVLARALQKARYEYIRVAELQGTDAGPSDECWAEFEALAEYADMDGWYRENNRALTRESDALGLYDDER